MIACDKRIFALFLRLTNLKLVVQHSGSSYPLRSALRSTSEFMFYTKYPNLTSRYVGEWTRNRRFGFRFRFVDKVRNGTVQLHGIVSPFFLSLFLLSIASAVPPSYHLKPPPPSPKDVRRMISSVLGESFIRGF